MKLFSYNAKTLKTTEIKAPSLWEGEPNMDLLSQAFYVYTDRSHKALARTKGRGEISASTRKIYKQKGTGGARHGSISAPIFVGGGIVHGPRNFKRELGLPKVMKSKALESAYKFKAQAGKLLVATELSSITKTKEAVNLISQLKKDNKNTKTILFISENTTPSFTRIFRNIPKVTCMAPKDVSTYDILRYSLVIVAEDNVDGKTKKVVSKNEPVKNPKAKVQKSEIKPKKAQKKETK